MGILFEVMLRDMINNSYQMGLIDGGIEGTGQLLDLYFRGGCLQGIRLLHRQLTYCRSNSVTRAQVYSDLLPTASDLVSIGSGRGTILSL